MTARRGERGEERYRVRRIRGAEFRTSRQIHRELGVVVKRFPHRTPPLHAVGDARADDATGTADAVFVLVHGLGVSSRYFQPLAAELARRGAVYLVDLPGYGAAPDPRRDVSIDDHAAVLASVLERAGVPDPILVGHSMGAQVVAALAARHPHIASRLVLMAPTMDPGSRSPGVAIARLLRDALREPPAVVAIAVTDYLIRCGLPYLLRQLPHLVGDRVEERMPRLAGRVLVLAGDRDPIVPRDWAAHLAALAPRGRYREVHGAHVVMHTAPRLIAANIESFLG